MNNSLYLVVSHENFCIYTCSRRHITANALAAGSVDCFVRAVNPHMLNNFDKFKNPKEFYDNVWKNDKRTGQLVSVDSTQVSESWLANRELLRRRHIIFGAWESYTISALLRVDTTKWPAFSAVADTELKNCDPKNNIYTPMIEEYARISERSVEQVFDELKLKIETENITKFRVTALAEKFKDMINQATTQSDLDTIRHQMYVEFWGNAET